MLIPAAGESVLGVIQQNFTYTIIFLCVQTPLFKNQHFFVKRLQAIDILLSRYKNRENLRGSELLLIFDDNILLQ
jgi:hypothetical protein